LKENILLRKSKLHNSDVKWTWSVSFEIKLSRNESSVGISTGYGLDCGSSIPGRGKSFFAAPQCPDRL
jgi:hypothetical protein